MREKIERKILEYIDATKAQVIHSHDDVFLTNQILTLLKEEIRKVRSENPYSSDDETDSFFAFDLACVNILKILGVNDERD